MPIALRLGQSQILKGLSVRMTITIIIFVIHVSLVYLDKIICLYQYTIYNT